MMTEYHKDQSGSDQPAGPQTTGRPDHELAVEDTAASGYHGVDPREGSNRPISRTVSRRSMLAMIFTFGLGAGAGYLGRSLGVQEPTAAAQSPPAPEPVPDLQQVSATQPVSQPSVLPYSYEVSARYGQLGPELLDVGAIDYDQFAAAQQRAGQPLTEYQTAILREGSEDAIVFDRSNEQFLLNFFWALGLANENPILSQGPITRRADGDISGFASTGGWTAGARPATEIYSATSLQSLTASQQGRLATVASAAYRPCCNNPTLFPDCNHGMALLGLLEIVAATDADLDELYTVAKQVNSFWYPQQATEVASFFRHTRGQTFEEIDPRLAVAPEYFSSTGYEQVNQWLAQNSLLESQSSSGSGCSL